MSYKAPKHCPQCSCNMLFNSLIGKWYCVNRKCCYEEDFKTKLVTDYEDVLRCNVCNKTNFTLFGNKNPLISRCNVCGFEIKR